MAIVQNNLLFHNFHGKFGKSMVFRVVRGKTIVSKYPDMSRVERSPDQKAYNNLFREAVQHAKSELIDPNTKAALLNRMKRNPKLKDRNPMNVLVSEYLRERSYIMSREEASTLVVQYNQKYQLNERQSAALKFLLIYGEINNTLYLQINKVSRPTATRDLADLVIKGILLSKGKGPATSYKLQDKLLDDSFNLFKN